MQKYIPRSWLALVANGVMAAKGDNRRFAADRTGNWSNIQPEATIVGPDLHTAHFSQVEATVRSYWFQEYTPTGGDIVIDIGSGIGEDVVVFSHLVGKSGRVHAVEAHPRTFKCLEATVRESKLTNVILDPIAITETNGVVHISDDAHHLASSIINGDTGIAVEAESLDRFIDRSGHSAIDFLKMNIEGAERGAFLGLERHAGRIRRMAVSCHDFVAEAGESDDYRTKDFVRQRLTDLGFVVTSRVNATTPWEADVLFASRV